MLLNKIKLLTGNTDGAKDDLLELLIEMCSDEILSYCNLDVVPDRLNSILLKMVVQTYNRVNSEGIASQSFSGVSESFLDGYSADVVAALNSNKAKRKVRFL